MHAVRFVTRLVAALAAIACASQGFAQWSSVAYVDAQGRRWRQLDVSRGATWDQVATLCPVDGVTPCTGTLNNQSLNGWVWATRDQVRDLLVELGATIAHAGCASGSAASGRLFQYFNNTGNFDLTNFVEGWSATRPTAAGLEAYAYAPLAVADQESPGGMLCVENLGLRAEVNTARGVWLFRPACPADIDRDGTVGPADLSALLGSWGTGGAADLNRSGVVDGQDLALMLAAWGAGGC